MPYYVKRHGGVWRCRSTVPDVRHLGTGWRGVVNSAAAQPPGQEPPVLGGGEWLTLRPLYPRGKSLQYWMEVSG